MVLDLVRSPPEAIWNSFSARSGQRTKIRQFEKRGFETSEVRSEEELCDFYRYYAETMKHLGADRLPLSFFLDLRRTLGDHVRIMMLANGPLVAGGTLTILDPERKRAHGVFLAMNRDLPNRFSPSYGIYWEEITWAWEHRYETFTFGREFVRDLTDQNPRYRLKRAFGGTFEPRHTRIVPLTCPFALGLRYRLSRAGGGGGSSDQAAV